MNPREEIKDARERRDKLFKARDGINDEIRKLNDYIITLLELVEDETQQEAEFDWYE
jgi:prefoldin subunit 5